MIEDNIPGWFDWQDIYDDVARETPDGESVVELGVCLGKSLFYLARRIKESGKNIKIYAIDEWDDNTFFDTVSPDDDVYHYIKFHGGFYQAFLYNLTSFSLKNYIHVIRARTKDIRLNFTPYFTLVDASHDYDSAKHDILAFKAPWMAGHDFTNQFPGVVKAVKEIFPDAKRRGNSWEAK